MYEKMYHTLFSAITDAMELMEAHDYQSALSRLERACQETEEMYVSQ